MQSEDGGISVESSQTERFEPGSRIDAVGFPEPGQYAPALARAVVHMRSSGPPPAPIQAAAAHMIQFKDGFEVAPYDGLLVRTEGELVDKIDHADEQVACTG